MSDTLNREKIIEAMQKYDKEHPNKEYILNVPEEQRRQMMQSINEVFIQRYTLRKSIQNSIAHMQNSLEYATNFTSITGELEQRYKQREEIFRDLNTRNSRQAENIANYVPHMCELQHSSKGNNINIIVTNYINTNGVQVTGDNNTVNIPHIMETKTVRE